MKTIKELQEEYNNSTGVRRARAAIELRNQGVDPDAPRAVKPAVPPRPATYRERPLPTLPTSQPFVGIRNVEVTTDTNRLAATTRSVAAAADTRERVRTAEAAVSTITVKDRGLINAVLRSLGRGGTHEEQDNTAQVIVEAINAVIRNNSSAYCHAVAHHDQEEWALVRQYIEPLQAKIKAPDEEFMQVLRQLANAIVKRRENKQRSVTFSPIQQSAGSEMSSQSSRASVTTSTSDDSQPRSKRFGEMLRKGFGTKY